MTINYAIGRYNDVHVGEYYDNSINYNVIK